MPPKCSSNLADGGIRALALSYAVPSLSSNVPTSLAERGKSYNCGAATFAFIQAIMRHRGVWSFDIVYGELLLAMYDELRNSSFRKQEPTLSSSLPFDCMSSRTKLKL